MIDHHGDEWLTVPDAAARIGVDAATIRQWKRRGKVTAHTIAGRVWVRMADVLDAEHDTRGRYLAQRGGECHTAASRTRVPKAR